MRGKVLSLQIFLPDLGGCGFAALMIAVKESKNSAKT